MAAAACAASERLTASGKPGFEVKVIGTGDIITNTTEYDGQQVGRPFFTDADGEPIDVVFKLYPWEWALQNWAGRDIVENMLQLDGIAWVEPIWKMLWSNKGILAILWEMFRDTPDARLLIPAYFEGEEPKGFANNCIRKPIHGREGGNAVLTVNGQIIERGPESHYDGDSLMGEPAVLQQYCALPSFPSYLDGDSSTDQGTDYHPVFGLWTVGTGVVALLIRESPNLVTNNLSYAVPHLITDICPDA